MANKTFADLGARGTPAGSDLLGVYPSGGPLKQLSLTNYEVRLATMFLALDGSADMTGALFAADGTANNPSISFTNSPTTGFYNVSSGVLGLTASGVDQAHMSSAGLNWIVAPTYTNPAAAQANLGIAPTPPQGRITIQTGVPVPVTDITGATTVYYAPFLGQQVPIYNGTSFIMTSTGGQLSQATSDSTKSPAAVTTNSNYDLFVWSDTGTIRCTRGPAWTSATARGTGAGTTELTLLQGFYVNANAITNGPGANLGTYVGTVHSDGSSQINDTVKLRHVWNVYNRRRRAMSLIETTDSWTYTTAPFRQANGSTANQFDIVRGLDEDAVTITAHAGVSSSVGTPVSTGIGVDSTTVSSAQLMPFTQAQSARTDTLAQYVGYPGLGRHLIQWLELSGASGTTTWYGDNGSPGIEQSGMTGMVDA